MAERLPVLLLAAILLASIAGATASFMRLESSANERRPVVLVVRPNHVTSEWQGSSSGDCADSGYDRCSDSDDVNEGTLDALDNAPLFI
jgi:hypothetical protein